MIEVTIKVICDDKLNSLRAERMRDRVFAAVRDAFPQEYVAMIVQLMPDIVDDRCDDDDDDGFHSQQEYEAWEQEWHPEW